MKSVAELIANKDALLKRDKHGKITAASLTAAGAAVLAAAQAEAQSIDGFEDITRAVVSFERLGNGQVEFQLENGQRFIANEGQYVIDGNQIQVSSELVTIVGMPGLGADSTVIAVAVAGAALLVGLLILSNSSNASDDDSTTTTTTTTSTVGSTIAITDASSGEIEGTAKDDTFNVNETEALAAITEIDGGEGTDTVKLTEDVTNATSPSFDLGARSVTLTNIENFEVTVDADGSGVGLDMNGEATALKVTNKDSGSTNAITITDLGPTSSGGSAAKVTLAKTEGGQTVNVDTQTSVSSLAVHLESAGDNAGSHLELDLSGSTPTVTSLTLGSDGSSTNFVDVNAAAGLTTLNVSGSAKLEIVDGTIGGAGMTGVTTFNASGASGDIKATVDSTLTSMTLGSGNDTITATDGPTGTSNWNGGGGTDTLNLAGIDTSGSTLAGFENLVVATGGTLDFATISDVDDVKAQGTLSIENVAADDIDEQITYAHSASVTNVSTSTATSLNFKGAGAVATEDVTITNNAAPTTALNLQMMANGTTNLLGTNTDKLTVTGNKELILTGAGGAALTELDASGAAKVTATADDFTALKTYEGSGGIDDIDAALAASADIDLNGGNDQIDVTNTAGVANINGGGGDDTINVGGATGIVTVVGGAGKDTVSLNGTDHILDFEALTDMATVTSAEFAALADFAALQGKAEVVTNFTDGTDQIQIKDLTANDDVEVLATAYDVGAAGFDDMVTAALARFNAGNDVVIAHDNSTTNYYVLVDAGQSLPGSVGTIGVIHISGQDIVAGDII